MRVFGQEIVLVVKRNVWNIMKEKEFGGLRIIRKGDENMKWKNSREHTVLNVNTKKRIADVMFK